MSDSKVTKAGYVAVIGRPNVGKSTMVNALLSQKVAAVSPRPQTTRRRQLGILTGEKGQIIFVDTPGLHIPHHKLGEYMNEVAAATLEDADVLLWLVDANEAPQEEDQLIAARLAALKSSSPVLLDLNKIDLVAGDQQFEREKEYMALLPTAQPVRTAAVSRRGVDKLLDKLWQLLPEGQPFYDEEQVTDLYEREIAADLIREAALVLLRDEVPHGIAIRIDEFTERNENTAYIGATIFVERESHKGIVIGHGGEMLKHIGSNARKEIETMSGKKIFLELRVKVNKNWRNSYDALRLLGYANEKDQE